MARGNHQSSGKSFRSGKEQARHAAEQLAAHGTARHTHRDDGTVKAIGSERVLKNDLKCAAEWLAARDPGANLATMTRDQATDYLQHRAEAVRQSQLDSDRQSLDKMLAARDGNEYQKLQRVKSELPAQRHNKHYSQEQTALVAAHQRKEANRLSTMIVAATGIRSHELYTLRPVGGGHAADHRAWRNDRFNGLGDGVRWLVTGKGGLVREVWLPAQLDAEVRKRELPESQRVRVTDRGVHYVPAYALAGGNAWSSSFTRASQRALGWSEGGHALRHTYVQQRMTTLTADLGYDYESARLTLSQELGHFRPDLLSWYGYP